MDKDTINHIIKVLRRGTITWKGRSACINKNRKRKRVGTFKNGKPKYKYFYYCDVCSREYTDTSFIEVDHIVEIGSFTGDFHAYVSKMYCSQDNLQAICISCHKDKTSKFNASIRYSRKVE